LLRVALDALPADRFVDVAIASTQEVLDAERRVDALLARAARDALAVRW
jgi:hypothetical protein